MTIVFFIVMLVGFICAMLLLHGSSPRAKWSDLTSKQWWLIKGVALVPIGAIGLIIVGAAK